MLNFLKKTFTRVFTLLVYTGFVACSSDAQFSDTQVNTDKKINDGFYIKSGQILRELEEVEEYANQIIVQQQTLSSHPLSNSPEDVDDNAHVSIIYDCGSKCFSGEFSFFKEIMDSAFTVPCEMIFLEAKISLSKNGKPLWSVYLADTEGRVHYRGQCFRVSHDPMPVVSRGGILVWNTNPIKYENSLK